jgi:hypothetical protein
MQNDFRQNEHRQGNYQQPNVRQSRPHQNDPRQGEYRSNDSHRPSSSQGSRRGVPEENRHRSSDVAEQSTMRVSTAVTEQPADELDEYLEYRDYRDYAEKASINTPDDAYGAAEDAKSVPYVRIGSIIALTIIESVLVLMAFLPQSVATRLGWSSTFGPFPASLAPVLTALFYLIPSINGFLSRRWEFALINGTLPVWAGIGLYLIGSSSREGIFAMARDTLPTNLAGTIQLFAILSFIGWLIYRTFFNRESAQTK